MINLLIHLFSSLMLIHSYSWGTETNPAQWADEKESNSFEKWPLSLYGQQIMSTAKDI